MFTLFDHGRLIHGHRYEFVRPRPSRGLLEEAADWSAQNFGPMGTNEGQARWWTTSNGIWFRDEQDALAFRLRWC